MIGRIISHYRIEHLLGEGGMGVVYLATDTQLGRLVALKFLSAHEDQNFRARFIREARAISALSHPHIATIYDYSETAEGEPYIVMEFVDGQTLGALLHGSALTILRAIEIINAVAQALSAAHAHGIVHRDIKPSNVIVSADGVVKVVDFGLAKLLNEAATSADPEAQTLLATRTHSDVIVGTPLYLSPEQASSAPVDQRSDLFALGALLYECITGRAAFSGRNALEIAAQVLHAEPPPPSTCNPRVPPELDRITLKALAKQPEARYQTAAELIADLAAVRATLNSRDDVRTQRWHTPAKASRPSTLRSVTDTLSRPRLSIIFFALTVAAISLGLWFILRGRTEQPLAVPSAHVVKLTNAGKFVRAAVSPDGKYVAQVVEDGEMQTLLISSYTTASSATIVPADKVKYIGLTFAPAGDYLYFVRYEASSSVGQLYQVPFLGGGAKRLIEGVDSPITFAPDGQKFAFVRFDKSKATYALIVADTHSLTETIRATRAGGARMATAGVAWSPDGQKIVFAAGSWAGGYHMDLFETGAEAGTEQMISSRHWFLVSQIASLPGGRDLIITAAEQPVSPSQIWKVARPAGHVAKLTNDTDDYYDISLPADGARIISVQDSKNSKVWVAPVSAPAQAKSVASVVGQSYGLAWTRNGKLVFSSLTGGNLNIFSMNADGSDKRQLTIKAGDNYHPAGSADGRFIFFSSDRTGTFNIWRMNAEDGGAPVQLTNGGGDFYPTSAPDNNWLVYERQSNGVPTLWRIATSGGTPVQLTAQYASVPAVSPDSSYIACRYFIGANVQGIAIMPLAGGAPVKLLPIPILNWQRVRWLPKQSALTYIDVRNGNYNLWSQAVDGGAPKQLTNFAADRIFAYDYSPDGKQLAFERGVSLYDVVEITNFR